jgi:exodeoxyribonuclease VII large subunit
MLLQSPSHRCQRARQTIHYMQIRSERAIGTRIESARAAESALRGRLNALSPLAVLQRGYSLTYTHEGRLLRSTGAVAGGDTLKTRLAHGTVTSTVRETTDES